MKSDSDLSGARFQFKDLSHRMRAELLVTAHGLTLRLLDSDGWVLAEFHAPSTERDLILDIVMVLSGFGYARMLTGSASAAA